MVEPIEIKKYRTVIDYEAKVLHFPIKECFKDFPKSDEITREYIRLTEALRPEYFESVVIKSVERVEEGKQTHE